MCSADPLIYSIATMPLNRSIVRIIAFWFIVFIFRQQNYRAQLDRKRDFDILVHSRQSEIRMCVLYASSIHKCPAANRKYIVVQTLRTHSPPVSPHGKQQTFLLKMFRIENRFGFSKIGFRRIVFYLNIFDIPIYRFLFIFLSLFRSQLPVCHFTGIIRFCAGTWLSNFYHSDDNNTHACMCTAINDNEKKTTHDSHVIPSFRSIYLHDFHFATIAISVNLYTFCLDRTMRKSGFIWWIDAKMVNWTVTQIRLQENNAIMELRFPDGSISTPKLVLSFFRFASFPMASEFSSRVLSRERLHRKSWDIQSFFNFDLLTRKINFATLKLLQRCWISNI